MERGEELMELNRAAADRNTEAFGRLMACFDRHEKAFDRHEKAFDRHEKAFERHEQAFERHEETFDRLMATLDRHDKKLDEHRLFIREMNLRNDKVVQQIVRDHEDFMADLKARDEQAERRTDAITARMEEVTKEQRAQREALLAVIDRLPPTQAA